MNQALYVQQSKDRCKLMGIDPTPIPQFTSKLSAEELRERRSTYAEILAVIRPFAEKFIDSMKGTPLVFLVNDDQGYVLDILGDETIQQALDQLNFHIGVQFQEPVNGTNAVNLALDHDIPIGLVGPDHYYHSMSQSACYCSPFHSMDDQKILGCVGIMTSTDFANPFILTLLTTVVDSIERELLLLKQNKKLYTINQFMMDTSRSGIILTDSQGQITDFNIFAEKLTGISFEQAYGLPVFNIEPIGPYFLDCINNRTKYEDIELTFTNTADEKHICLFDIMPVYDKHDNLTGTFCHFRDITEFKRAEEMMRNSEKLSVVGQLAAGVAHEIRNPLTTLRGFVQFFHSDIKAPYAELMISELDRINFIVSEFLLLAKPQSVLFRRSNLEKILSETCNLFQTQAIMHNTTIQFIQDDSPLWIECDENQLKQVFINILKNSLEAMPSGGNIQVIVERIESEKVSIVLIDEGQGMSPSTISRISEPFYTTKENGTGLGLMVSKKIIESHHGQLFIDSEVGKGTRIEIVLPMNSSFDLEDIESVI
ncbi:ATP-binding protein [Ammoniphilus sp. CFH 90114]|uniref:ATP-binding protein n=1 Tax=Ammoniphilus sp. CFH 90114 TaxID=2493665 RepID=UPI00100FBF8F|nr:ATP-binding protein [Ammoniphilus sp. CFH 90114]RXT04257.1 PAS domain S-box protein [Ammoniphilus sp. CFH 90114]